MSVWETLGEHRWRETVATSRRRKERAVILSKVYEDAEHRLERNEITLGEFERLVDIEVIELKRGEWVLSSDGYGYIGNPVYKCSVCGWWDEQTPYNFCPNCGADMREREGE